MKELDVAYAQMMMQAKLPYKTANLALSLFLLLLLPLIIDSIKEWLELSILEDVKEHLYQRLPRRLVGKQCGNLVLE